MLAYKGFDPGLVCRGYQFKMGLNVTDKANCARNGFHCAENPLDCLRYYSDMKTSEYYIVNAGGDLDEDAVDSKISCTELTIFARLSREDFFLHALAYMADHPQREWNSHVKKDRACARNGFAIVRGDDPLACGKLGDILAFAKEDPNTKKITQVALATVDGKALKPDVWYNADFKESRMKNEKERASRNAADHRVA